MSMRLYIFLALGVWVLLIQLGEVALMAWECGFIGRGCQ
jgi:hypothetical protein